MPDPSGLFSTLAAMEVGGFNKADIKRLADAMTSIRWKFFHAESGASAWADNNARWLTILAGQETLFEKFMGVPERA